MKQRVRTFNPFFLLLGAALFSVAAIWLFFYCTPEGVGLTNDSSAYLGGARSILAGEGYVRFSGDRQPRPITQFPPMLSLFIAGIAWLGQTDVFTSAKLLNLICYVLNLLLFMWLIWRFSASQLAAMFAGGVYLACSPVLQAHVYGLSEALFLSFWLMGMILLELFTRKHSGTCSWLGLGVWFGLTMLVRYAAVSVLLAALVFVFARQPTKQERFRSAAAIVAGFLLAIAPWLIRNNHYSESAVNRSITFHLPNEDVIREGILNLSRFFMPERGQFFERTIRLWVLFWMALLVIALIWLIIVFIRSLRGRETEKDSRLFLVGLQTVGYVLVLITVALFVDGSTVFDHRMLLPFFVGACAMILLIVSCALFKRSGWGRLLGILILLIFTVLLVEDELDLIREYHRDGQGFASVVWKESETANAVNGLPESRTFYSNRQTYLWLMKERPAYILPVLMDAATQKENDQFENESDQLQEQIQQGDAYAVVFNYQMMLEDPTDQNWLSRLFDHVPVYGEFEDGIIFGVHPGS